MKARIDFVLLLVVVFIIGIAFIGNNISGRQLQITDVPGEATLCIDTDVTREYPDGKNPFIKGTTRTRYSSAIDKCIDYYGYLILNEFVCQDGQINGKLIPCGGLGAYYCDNGACVEYEYDDSTFYRVFVTSQSWSGNLGGLEGADLKCQRAAQQAGLGGNWKAWISEAAYNATDRLFHSPNPYLRLDGAIIAVNWEDLTDGNILNPINMTEYGEFASSYGYNVWTGTDGLGHFKYPNCNRFLDSSANVWGVMGKSSYGIQYGPQWTYYATGLCSDLRHLFCFEQP